MPHAKPEIGSQIRFILIVPDVDTNWEENEYIIETEHNIITSNRMIHIIIGTRIRMWNHIFFSIVEGSHFHFSKIYYYFAINDIKSRKCCLFKLYINNDYMHICKKRKCLWKLRFRNFIQDSWKLYKLYKIAYIKYWYKAGWYNRPKIVFFLKKKIAFNPNENAFNLKLLQM